MVDTNNIYMFYFLIELLDVFTAAFLKNAVIFFPLKKIMSYPLGFYSVRTPSLKGVKRNPTRFYSFRKWCRLNKFFVYSRKISRGV